MSLDQKFINLGVGMVRELFSISSRGCQVLKTKQKKKKDTVVRCW